MPSSLDVSPLNSCQGQPRKKTSQQIMQSCKIMLLFVAGCWWTFKKYTKDCKKHRFWKQQMLFMTCCWKSRPLKENHVEWLGFFKLLGCTHCISPTQNVLPFTHAIWWQSRMACVWIFGFLVSPSIQQKTGKNSSPDWKAFSHKNYHFSGFAGVVAICRVFAGFLAGRSCRKNNVIVAFVVFAHHCRQPTKLRGALRSKSCFASYIFTCQILFERFGLKADILLYQHGRPKKCKMAANRLKPREYAILVKMVVCTKNLAT